MADGEIGAARQTPEESLPTRRQEDAWRGLIIARKGIDFRSGFGIDRADQAFGEEGGFAERSSFKGKLQGGIRGRSLRAPKFLRGFGVFTLHDVVLPFGELDVLRNLLVQGRSI